MDAQTAGPTLDSALANGRKVTLNFGKKAGGEIRALLNMQGVYISTVDERGLRGAASASETDCTVIITLEDDFPDHRKKFEDKVLKGVTELEIAA